MRSSLMQASADFGEKYGIGQSDQRVDDYRACRSCTRKDVGYEVKAEEAEKPPVQRTHDDEDIGNNVC